jgi:hypothetical protein
MTKHTAGPASTQPWVDRFGEIPVIGEAIYAVNPSIPADFLVQEVSCLLDAMAEVAAAGVETPITATAAWMLESNLRRVQALLSRVEDQLVRVRWVEEQRSAA